MSPDVRTALAVALVGLFLVALFLAWYAADEWEAREEGEGRERWRG